MTPTELWESNKRLAKYLATKRARNYSRGDIAEDLLQSSLMALWIAANKYDESFETSFPTYAYRWIVGELFSECWRQHTLGFKAGKAESSKTHIVPEKGQFFADDVFEDKDLPDSVYADKELLDYIIRQIPSEKMRVVARRYWIEGISLKTIAHQLGVSSANAEKLHQRAYKRMVEIAERLKQEWGE